MFRYLPEQASSVAPEVDWIHNLITDLSVFFTVAICGAMLYFAFRYKRRDNQDHETPRIEGSNFLEMVWTVIPTLVCIWIGWEGIVIYQRMVEVPKDALEISVQAQKWKWDFEYENGKKTTGEFVVPVGKPVNMIMRSTDVLHSFFIPSMRVKKDVIPGRFTHITFTPVKTGTYHSFCTEYCGTNHSAMLASLRVVSQQEYDRWVNDRSEEEAMARLTPEVRGAKLYKDKGCNACHSMGEDKLIGPGFLKLFGKDEALADGTSVKVDENYLEESIKNPNIKIVKGFAPNQMPAYEGQLSDDELRSLIAFIKALDGVKEIKLDDEPNFDEMEAAADLSPAEKGRKIYETKLCITCHSLDGSKVVGPTFQGIYGKKGKLADGSEYTADDAYLKDSIWKPAAQVVEGYPPAMPAYEGQLSDEDLNNLIEFMKTLK